MPAYCIAFHIDTFFSTLYSNENAFVKWQFNAQSGNAIRNSIGKRVVKWQLNVQMTMQSAIQFVLF